MDQDDFFAQKKNRFWRNDDVGDITRASTYIDFRIWKEAMGKSDIAAHNVGVILMLLHCVPTGKAGWLKNLN